MGLDNISSVSVGKFHDKFAQYAYDQDFTLPSAPSAPVVSGLEHDGRISLDWGHDQDAYMATEDVVNSGFEFEGYNVYQYLQLPRHYLKVLKLQLLIKLTQSRIFWMQRSIQ